VPNPLRNTRLASVWTHYAAALILLLLLPADAQSIRGPLREAALRGDLPRIKVLLKKSPGFLKTSQGGGVLCMGAFSGNKPVVLYLLSQGSKVNERDADGSTPLYQAANGGNLPIVQLLLAKGAKVNQARTDGWTPLHAAVAIGARDIVELLLAKGASLSAKAGRKQETPHEIAVKYKHPELAELLQKRAKR
jgi:uncharacterized protein